MLTNKYEPKTMAKHISCSCKRKCNGKTCISSQKWKNKTCQCECENYRICKKIIVGILGYGFISDYITTNNYYYLLSLCTTKMH